MKELELVPLDEEQDFLQRLVSAKPGEIVEGPANMNEILMKQPKKPLDTVKSPNHYVLRDGLEVWDVRDALLEKMEGKITLKQADSWSRAWEYLTRAFLKNGKEDLMKTRQYLDRLIEETN